MRGTARASLPPGGLPSLANVAGMKDIRGEVREFLTTRRAKVTPEQAGLPRYGGRRRVTGLRRDEVAQLAGISIEYYTRLERGNIRGISAEVLDGTTWCGWPTPHRWCTVAPPGSRSGRACAVCSTR